MAEKPVPAYSHLARLQTALDAKGFETRLGGSSLIMIAPAIEGESGPRPADTVVCRARDSDGGRMWFWTSWGEPITKAEDLTGAAVIIAGYLTPQP
ncbi:hypothetical protein [Spirillospora sp. CA-128828]|uniref:hypothetical protein n=1 Tax=Spirillospora sp. CA-128828 TaxID=3240033 RepID=UPI003D8DE319